jgi:hypothetical protein
MNDPGHPVAVVATYVIVAPPIAASVPEPA